MTGAARAVHARPGAVLRRALVAWGLGDLALGRPGAALGWLAGEIVAATTVAYLLVGLRDTTWYLVPFLAGIAFLAVWALQAVRAYWAAQREQGAIGPTPARSPAAAVAWLSVPLLVWGTGFWLVAGGGATPSAVVDRFESSWPVLASGGTLDPSLGLDAGSTAAAGKGLSALEAMCRSGELASDCRDAPANLLRDVRFSIVAQAGEEATAVAELVGFERRDTRILGVLSGTELVPVPRGTIIRLSLRAEPAPLPGGMDVGAREWRIVNAETP